MQQVLVIEDDPSVREVIRDLLSPHYQVHEAGTTMEIVAALNRQKPDLITLDLSLPDFNGFEILDWLHENSPQVPVLLITGNDTLESAEEAVRLQAAGFITKPLNPIHLLLTVQECLGLRSRLTSNLNSRYSKLLCKG